MAESTYTAPATYTITFPSLSQAEVKVSIDGVLQSSGFSISGYATSGSGTVTFTSAPASGATVRIFRDTTILSNQLPAPKSDFQPGASIKAEDLNVNMDQVLYKLAEKVDQSDISNDAIVTQAIRDSNVTTDKIADSAVTTAKINNSAVTTDKINNSAVTAVKLSDDAVTTDKIADSSITTAKIANSSVTTAKLADSSVTTAKINDAAVTNAKLADNSVSLAKMQDNSVNTAELVADAVTNAKLADNSVAQANMQDNSVGTAELVADAVTNAKLADNSVALANMQDNSVSTAELVADAVTQPKLAANSVTNRQIADGSISGTKITNGTLDIQSILAVDIRTLAEQNASPSDAGSDDELGTTAANNKRYDTIYQTGTPSGNDFATGKLWYNHDGDQTLSVWSGTAWINIASGGTFTTQPTVIYVDSRNGSDDNDGHRIIDPKKTIKDAVADAQDGDIILVAPGVYRETLPIIIGVNNLSIVGQSLRSCFIHPTPATETNSMFHVNSGTQISNFTFMGLKASGTRGQHSIDNHNTYGLPQTQAWVAEFKQNAIISKSPYIQNCTNFADSGIKNHTQAEYDADNTLGSDWFNPNSATQQGFGGDITSGPSGGGLLIDGSKVHATSPLRSMVVDAFTQIALDGPGVLCCNNGYGQLVSFFGTFCHYHAKALNGGQLNLSNCTSDYGRYGLIADGKSSPNAIFTATVSTAAATGATTFTIGAPTAGTGWYGSATRPQENMLVTIGSDTYGILSATANGTGWNVTISNPNPSALSTNLGLTNAIAQNVTASFFNRSYISTGGHTFEYVGAGTDYRAAPENGGVPNEANQVITQNDGKVYTSSTDHNGKFKVGDTFSVDQRTGEVTIETSAYKPEVVNDDSPKLGGNLDVNGKDITGTVKLNGLTYPSSDGATDQVLKTNGSGTLSFVGISALQGSGLSNLSDDTTPQLGGELDAVTNKIINLGTPTANTDAATKAYVDSSNVFIETAQTLSTNKTISSNVNAVCAGPMAIASSVTLTIGSNSKLLVLN